MINIYTSSGMQAYIDGEGPYEADLTIEQEVALIEYGPGERPDLEWVYTDKAGHEHRYDQHKDVPTLKAKLVPCNGMCGDSGHMEVKHYRCRLCREKIKPGTRWEPGGTLSFLGLKKWEARVYGFSGSCEYYDITLSGLGQFYRGRGIIRGVQYMLGGLVESVISGIGELEEVNENTTS